MKLFFKRYLDFERKFGDAFSVENVKTKAMEYVESKAALSWQHCGMNCGEVLERSSLAERNWKIWWTLWWPSRTHINFMDYFKFKIKKIFTFDKNAEEIVFHGSSTERTA